MKAERVTTRVKGAWLSIRLDERIKARLERMADRAGMGLSEYVRHLLAQAVSKK